MGAEYQLIFEGHDPLVFAHLGSARDRAKEPPPETAQAAEISDEPAEETATAAPPAEVLEDTT